MHSVRRPHTARASPTEPEPTTSACSTEYPPAACHSRVARPMMSSLPGRGAPPACQGGGRAEPIVSFRYDNGRDVRPSSARNDRLPSKVLFWFFTRTPNPAATSHLTTQLSSNAPIRLLPRTICEDASLRPYLMPIALPEAPVRRLGSQVQTATRADLTICTGGERLPSQSKHVV